MGRGGARTKRDDGKGNGLNGAGVGDISTLTRTACAGYLHSSLMTLTRGVKGPPEECAPRVSV